MLRDPLTRSRAAPRALALAALAAALAVAAPAGAQTRKEPATKSPPRPPSTSTSTSTTAVAAPAARSAVPLPPAPVGTSLQPRRAGWLAASAGAWSGFDAGKGVAVVVDYGFVRTPPSWSRAELEVHLSATLAHPSESTDLTTTVLVPPYGTPVTVSSGVETMKAWVVEVVPTARVRFPVGPKLGLFADGGLGLAQTIEQYDRDEMFAGRTETTRNQTTLVLRLGGGLTFDLTERARVLFVPLALSLQLGTGFSAYVPTLGLAYRL